MLHPLSGSFNSGPAIIVRHDEVLHTQSTLMAMSSFLSRSSDNGPTSCTAFSGAVSVNISLHDLPISDVGRQWLLWYELIVDWWSCFKLSCECWRSSAGLSWDWLVGIPLHFSDSVCRPLDIHRFPPHCGHSEYTNIGSNQMFARPHVEAEPKSFVPQIFELAWGEFGVRDLEMYNLTKFS